AEREAAARVYHAASPRSAGPFVPVACAALPDGVAERLMFGAKKGFVESIGQLQMAQGGTLFLDEVAALGPNVQARLLHVVAAPAKPQQRDIVRVDDLDASAGLSAHQLVAETAVERPKRETPPADLGKAEIEAALARAKGVIHIAARILGIHRTQLYQLMDRH